MTTDIEQESAAERTERLAGERERKIRDRTENLLTVAAMLAIRLDASATVLVEDAAAILDAAEQSATRFVDAGLSEDPTHAE